MAMAMSEKRELDNWMAAINERLERLEKNAEQKRVVKAKTANGR